jgi:glycine dehydrogenase subunit 1
MPYTFNTEDDIQQMLEAIGAASMDELFEAIPADLRLNQPLDLPTALTELELTQHLQHLAGQNKHAGNATCFLGAGSYDHFIPAVVDAIASRGEFYTSYTPYQPEVSQGNLQVMFEYQTLICQLTGMDVSNASLYDGGTAAIEAALLAMSATKRAGKVVALGNVHPEYLQIMGTYFTPLGTNLLTVPTPEGIYSAEQLVEAVDEETACVVVQNPNFFGCVENVQTAADIAHERGALLVVVVDPISLGLLKRPGDVGADVVVAEGQGLGTSMQFGGPYLGIMACREKFVRRMPGRIAGQTVDRRGRRCWVLTLQTREQHIRRAKATSNICTNQGLFALRAAVYLATMGPQGMRDTATLCLQKAAYAAEEITRSDRFELAFDQPFFKEFVVRDRKRQVDELLAEGLHSGLLAGLPLGKWFPDLDDCFLVAVTEKRTRDEIDKWVGCLSNNRSAAVPV